MKHVWLTLLLGGAGAQTVTGVASVVDGDTLSIRGVKVRLAGVDAVESSQVCVRAGARYGCGRAAALALSDLLGQRPVTCTRRDTDRYGRLVGDCVVGGLSVNRWVVQRGWALPYLAFGGSAFVKDAAAARAAGLGVHAGTYQEPWAYRRDPRAPFVVSAPTAAVVFASCAQARAAGAAPIRRGSPGYRAGLDGNGDGVACE